MFRLILVTRLVVFVYYKEYTTQEDALEDAKTLPQGYKVVSSTEVPANAIVVPMKRRSP